MKAAEGGFVRADKIDLKSLDDQLHRHFSRVLTLEKKVKDDEGEMRDVPVRNGWEIDPAKLLMKSVIARGTFGTVHRGFYDGIDVAGNFVEKFWCFVICFC